MKYVFAFIAVLLISFQIHAQQIKVDDLSVLWKAYIKENAPFSEVKQKNHLLQLKFEHQKLSLGNLQYKAKTYTLGQELLGVACLLTEAIKDHQNYKKRKYSNPTYFNRKDKWFVDKIEYQ